MNFAATFSSRIAWLSVCLAVASCGQDSSEPGSAELDSNNPSQARSGIVPDEALVPDTMFGENECQSSLPAATACMWAAQADAIVVAHITKLSPVDGPTMWPTPEGEWEEVHDCVFANPALSIGLQVDRTLSGTLDGDVTVMIGGNQVQHFNPLPVSGDSGSIEWIPTHLSNRGPLWVGQRIMLGLHRIEQGWSLMGDTILGIDSQGTVFAPERTADCLSTDPIDVHGLSIDAVAELMACSPDPVGVEERRAARESAFGDAVSTYATQCGSR